MTTNDDIFTLTAVEAARKLLGWRLVHDSPGGTTRGLVVETEAYMGKSDAASHSYRGETARTRAMFGPPGHAYIYFTYGMHYCFNVVTGPVGAGQAVLIRALQPLDGIETMSVRRKQNDIRKLCNGPANLVQALGITKDHYGADLRDGCLRLEQPNQTPLDIVVNTRIGINQAKDMPWRFYIKDNPFVSKP